MDYDFSFFYIQRGFPALIDGLMVTLKLTAVANAIGLTLGFVIALCAMSRSVIVRWPIVLFIEIFRCTPALIQILWFFYCIPIVLNLFVDPILMGFLALGLNLACFNGEAYRAALQSVPREQVDAGIALGLTPLQRVRYIVFPHAFRTAMPVLITNGISIFQQSALVAVVAIADLMYAGRQLATATYKPIETYTAVALIYFAVSLPISLLVHHLEHRLDRSSV